MTTAMTAALVLVLLTFSIHYWVLRWLSGGMAAISMKPGFRVLMMVLVALAAHLVEIALYAVAYGLGENVWKLGGVHGLSQVGPLDYFYFSIVSYTSLGLGDIVPTEHLRFITGVEALNGLLLIAWSASFIYLAMARLWPWRPCAEPGHPAADTSSVLGADSDDLLVVFCFATAVVQSFSCVDPGVTFHAP